MRVLVLGGTALTGPFVVRRLCAQGHEITVFHRGEHEADLPGGVRHIHGSLTDPPAELRRLSADVVVDMWAMNQFHAAAFLETFRTSAGRAVVISSCDVYRAYGRLQRLETGPPDASPLTEDSPLRESRYPYQDDYDKILVEETLRLQPDIPVTILRYPAVYGPNDTQRFGPWVHQMGVRQMGAPEIRMDEAFAAWRWTHGFAENVAEAVVLAVTQERAAGRTYNVGEPSTPTWFERVESLARVMGWQGRVVLEDQHMPHDFAHNLVVDSSLIRSELGYAEPVPYEEALRRAVG
jgi:nucleoside-diphosphate-sugar epimerase